MVVLANNTNSKKKNNWLIKKPTKVLLWDDSKMDTKWNSPFAASTDYNSHAESTNYNSMQNDLQHATTTIMQPTLANQ